MVEIDSYRLGEIVIVAVRPIYEKKKFNFISGNGYKNAIKNLIEFLIMKM